jgi:beta-phosphoglucomutase
MIKAFIFDMDGTLVDNMHYHEKAWQKLLREMGRPMSIVEIRKYAYGKNEETFERIFTRKFEATELQTLFKRKETIYRELYTPHLALIKGVIPFLDEAKSRGIKMAIGTGAGISNMNFILDGLQIRHYFDTLVYSEIVTNGKPHPETFLKCAENLGSIPEESLVFEDVESGAQAAHNGGMKSVMFSTTYKKELLAAMPSVIKVAKDYEELSIDELISI